MTAQENFAGKSVLVTGATRGIGREIVTAFLKAGAQVAVNGTTEQSVARALAERGPDEPLVAAPGDIGTVDGCRQTVEAAFEAFGKIDVLVNNAGINRDAPFLEIREEDWDSVMNVNLKGPFLLTQLVGRRMLETGGGSIVNVDAVTGVQARKNAANFCCSKAGLLMLTKCAALELAPTVPVNAIGLGFVRSELVAEVFNPDQLAGVIEETPLKRMAEIPEVADLVFYLASDRASFMTGQTIVFDGGRIMR
jgi:NAD(P)-dependent dehydrogenase (short-subunit alcohol dehydrogenase family)